MSKSCTGNNYKVILKMTKADQIEIEEVEIQLKSGKITFTKAGKNVQLEPTNQPIQVIQDGDMVFLVTSENVGVEVAYNWGEMVAVTVNRRHFDNTCGLCGKWNDNKAEEKYLRKNKNTASNSNSLGSCNRVRWDADCKPEDEEEEEERRDFRTLYGLPAYIMDRFFTENHDIVKRDGDDEGEDEGGDDDEGDDEGGDDDERNNAALRKCGELIDKYGCPEVKDRVAKKRCAYEYCLCGRTCGCKIVNDLRDACYAMTKAQKYKVPITECSVTETEAGACANIPDNVCMQQGHTFYKTFDGVEYQFQGACKYTMAAGGTWSVIVEHQNQNSFTRVKEVTINTPKGQEVTFKNNNVKVDNTVKNNRALEDGVEGDGFTLTMLGKSNRAKIVRYCDEEGIVVEHDFEQLIIVRLADSWKNTVSGLCGNFNDNSAEEDSMKGDLDNTHSANVINGRNQNCQKKENPGVCDGRSDNESRSQTQCQNRLAEKTCSEYPNEDESSLCLYENCLCSSCFCDIVQAYWSKCYIATGDSTFLGRPGAC